MDTSSNQPIALGTSVRTANANFALRSEWTDQAWENRQWGVQGTIVAYHGSHGFHYEVRHSDGTLGCYDPSELTVIQVTFHPFSGDPIQGDLIEKTDLVNTGDFYASADGSWKPVREVWIGQTPSQSIKIVRPFLMEAHS